MNIKQFIKQQFDNCMSIPEYNSRLVYLFTSLATVVLIAAVCIAFFIAKDKTGYDSVILALGGGGLASGISKWMQKSGQAKQDAANVGNDAPGSQDNVGVVVPAPGVR